MLVGTYKAFQENLFERSDPRFRSGQTRERIPSNAWARKIAAPTKPITAVIVSNISQRPLRPCATENGGDLAQSNFRAPTHKPIGRGFCATDVHRHGKFRRLYSSTGRLAM